MKPNSETASVPPAMKKALATNTKAKAAFAQLPVSHRNEYVKRITEAKQPETAARRLKKLIPMLLAKTGGKKS